MTWRLGRPWFGAVAVTGLTLFLAVAGSVPPAEASHCVTTDKLKTLSQNEDRFRNYDFESQVVGTCNIDWPVNFLFWNNADIGKVKDRMATVGYGITGSPMHETLNEGGGWVWDQDSGRKNEINCFFGDAEHFRIFADGDDRLYNMSWGYYVLGTSHIDHNECDPFGSTWFGASETAEARIADDARNAWEPSRVNTDAVNFQNHNNWQRSGDHILQSNGYATKVKVGAN